MYAETPVNRTNAASGSSSTQNLLSPNDRTCSVQPIGENQVSHCGPDSPAASPAARSR